MSNLIAVVLTIAYIAFVATLVIKRYNSVFVFMTSGIAVLLGFALITGQSVMGDATTGSAVIDVFAFTADAFSSNASGVGMTLMMVTGYAMYMSHIGASTKLAYLATKPLSKIKNPYIVLSMLFIIGALLKMVITSHAGLSMLLMAIAFPILTSLGISKLSAATVLIMCGFVDWGPNDSSAIFAAEEVCGMPMMDYFLTYQGRVAAVLIVLCAIFLPTYLSIMDKKDKSNALNGETETKAPENVDCPAFYAILPVIPLVLITVFSFVPNIKLGVPAATIALPMQLSAGIGRCMSPVAGVMIAISGMAGLEITDIVRRCAVPAVVMFACNMIVSYIVVML